LSGERYLYLESSSPPSFRPFVSLESAKDLRGCFCVKLQQHHNVESGRRHKLQIAAGNKVIYQISENQPYWKSLLLQVDSEKYVQV